MNITASARTDPGKVRQRNEDAVLFHMPSAASDSLRSGALAILADGMGGASGGSIASAMAVQEISRSYLASHDAPPVALKRAAESANEQIYRRALQDEHLHGMGTTCVVLAIDPPCAWAAWVGDSRLYLIRGGQIYQMTEDHSIVHEMVRRGLLKGEEAARHEDRNVVTRSLGSHATVEIALWPEEYPVRAGDRFLLCSDGLHDLLTSMEILQIAKNGPADVASGRLIDEANARGGYDNISAILVDLSEPGSKEPQTVPATREAAVQVLEPPDTLASGEW
ncbi:MAG TPA: PP2C family serine/threonine-protein phosphatase [Bryobacteraceae bacterium]|nr:PP2C family serine/threonine-protein phosphatase [Bryobacteraceae bacterium]